MIRRYFATVKRLSIAAALLAATTAPVKAADASNTCEIVTRNNGQFIRQTTGTAGEIAVYVNGEYATYIPRKNRLYYATSDQSAVVRGYDNDGLVC